MLAFGAAQAQAQSASATVGVSLRVLAPIMSTDAPALSVSVNRAGIASVRTQPSRLASSRLVTSLTAADEQGPLSAGFGPAGGTGARNRVELSAATLVGFGVLSPDTLPAPARPLAYSITLRDGQHASASDTSAVKVRLRYYLVVAGIPDADASRAFTVGPERGWLPGARGDGRARLIRCPSLNVGRPMPILAAVRGGAAALGVAARHVRR